MYHYVPFVRIIHLHLNLGAYYALNCYEIIFFLCFNNKVSKSQDAIAEALR